MVSKKTEWWQEFFSGSALDFVRYSRGEQQTQMEADFVQHALGLPLNTRILDVPCGAGRLSLELASRGYEVTGVDISLPLLEKAHDMAESRNLSVTWEQGDMRALRCSGTFDGAVCIWNSFGYFDEEGNSEFLNAVSTALKPGAPFVLDTPIIETWLPEMNADPRVWCTVRELLALEDRSFDHVTSRVESQWTFVREGKIERKSFSLRLYTYRELSCLLKKAGFGNHRPYSTLDFDPFEVNSEGLYMLTTKLENEVQKGGLEECRRRKESEC